MFSGIVERTVPFVGRESSRFWFGREDWDAELPRGSSVACNGVCLTVVATTDERFGVDVVPETIRRTNLGQLASGAPVNVERSVTLTTLLDGGLVLGHVDGVGQVARCDDEGIEVTVPARSAHLVVEKGTIVINGVALTVASLTNEGVVVALIPETRERTNLGLLREGALVNLEFDIVGKYVARWVELARRAVVEDR